LNYPGHLYAHFGGLPAEKLIKKKILATLNYKELTSNGKHEFKWKTGT
jgi:hypothetical protein